MREHMCLHYLPRVGDVEGQVDFEQDQKWFFLNFLPNWNSNIFTFQKYQEKCVWLRPLPMRLDFPSEGQGCNDTFFDMKSRAKSLTTATPGAASTHHEIQAWQFWGVLRSPVLSPWTQKTHVQIEVSWAARMKAFTMISRLLTRAQGICISTGDPETSGSPYSPPAELLKDTCVHQIFVKSGMFLLNVSNPSCHHKRPENV